MEMKIKSAILLLSMVIAASSCSDESDPSSIQSVLAGSSTKAWQTYSVEDENGDWWLQREGTNQSIRLSTAGTNSIGTDSLHNGTSMTWTGRMMQIEDPDSISLVFQLISADVKDSDGDGLSDDLESSFGTNPFNPDTDGDGSNDRFEIEEDTNPNSPN